MTLALYIAVVVVATAVTWKGSALLESSSKALAGHYQLPPVVEGAVLVAVGSSFPEISTTVISALIHGDFELGVSVVIGSAIFNILIIPAVAALAAGKIEVERMIVYRDAQFYLVSVAALLLVFSMAVIYHPVGESGLQGQVTKPLALIPLLLYGLYMFMQHQEASESRAGRGSRDSGDISLLKEWAVLVASLVLIIAGVEGLLRSAIFFGDYFDTPSLFWGATVVAAATSIPDAFVSVRLAQQDRGTVSIANVLGSNIVDLLVAIPLGVLATGAVFIDYARAVPLMGFLTAATVLLLALVRLGLQLNRRRAVLLLAIYALFAAWMVLEATHATSLLQMDVL